MGRQVDQAALFYEFSLDRHVPATHLLRSIDRFVVPAQPVDATQALNLSAGVSNCKVSRGRSFC
jgi:hypothetical protein